MAATVKREFVLRVMEEKELPYFQVTDGKDLIDENQTDSNLQNAMQQLNDVLDQVEDSVVVVKLSEKTKKQKGEGGVKGILHFEYKIRLKEGKAVSDSSVNGTVLSLLKEIQELRIAAVQSEKDHAMKSLQDQINELKKEEKSDPMMTMAMNALSGLMNNGKAATVAVAGIGEGEVDESKVDKISKIKAAITRLSKVDHDLATTLTMLADFAEANPNQYNQFKPMLRVK